MERRKSQIHELGKKVVFEHLMEIGYECSFCEDAVPCFDIEARKDGLKYLVSVRARNHTTDKNEEKTDCYNLFYPKKKGDDPDAVVKQAADIAQERNAIPMWAAVRIDVLRKVYDAYWGSVADLKNKKQIPMSPSDRRKHEKLAENAFDPRISEKWSNVKRHPIAREGTFASV